MTEQLRYGKSQLDSAKEGSTDFGLVIDGKSLAFALDKKLEKEFLKLALGCASVICCRSTPKQKALVSVINFLVPIIVIKSRHLCAMNVMKSN